MSRLHAFDESRLHGVTESRLHARGTGRLRLRPGQSGGSILFPAGIIGDSIQFYAYSPTFPMPSFRWSAALIGQPAIGWGRKSFTIRYWWRAGSANAVGSFSPLGVSIHGQFRTAYSNTFFVQPNINRVDVNPAVVVHVPTIRFGVWTGAAFEEIRHHFFQSPETSGGPLTGIPGGIVGPLIEMTEDAWHRTVAWYDEDTLEIGLQLDDLTPETAILSGPIPAGATQGLSIGEGDSINNFDYGFDEYGLWHDYAWTAGERLDDWNAGAGVGWPDVLDVVSKKPMAYFRFEPGDIQPSGVVSVV